MARKVFFYQAAYRYALEVGKEVQERADYWKETYEKERATKIWDELKKG
jgi:hypothetical protein